MEKRKVREFSPKTYQVLIGILICLTSVIISLNVGYVSRVLSFPFVYVLGMASYLLFAFLFVEGIFVIFKGSSVVIKISKYLWFSIILVFGLCGLLTYFAVNQEAGFLSFKAAEGQINVFDKLNSVFQNVKFTKGTSNYLQNKEQLIIFFGENEFGCGLLGYVMLTLGNSIFQGTIGGLVLSICLTAAGFLLICVPLIIGIVKYTKKAKQEKKEHPRQVDINSHKRIKNINVVKGAKNIDPKTYHTEVSGAGKNLGNYKEEIIEDPIDVESINPFTHAAFSEESLEEHMKEVNPAIDSLDEFREVVFDADGIQFQPSEKKLAIEEKYEPVEEISVYEPKKSDFGGIDEIEKLEENDDGGLFREPVKEKSHYDEGTRDPFATSSTNVYGEPARNNFSSQENNSFTQQPTNPFVKPVEQARPFEQQRPFEQAKPVEPVKPVMNTPVQNTQPVQDNKPKKQRVNFDVLNSGFLDTYETAEAIELNARVALERKDIINNTFKDFNVGAEVVNYTIGPSVTRFNIRYNSNVSVRNVANLVQDISIRLNGVSARFESVIEGQSTSGLEIPNEEITTVAFKDVYDALPNVKKHPLAVAFGKNIKGSVIYADFDEFPHMLVSGTTGSGKSVFVNSIICTLIMRNSPDDLKLVLVDPKKVEMSRYADMPHLLTPIITEPQKVKLVLDKLVDEMEYRYNLFSKNNATNIKEYNEDCEYNGNERMPYIVVVLDEYADLVEQCKDISYPVVMLAQKARACGIHIMLSTQRPSTNVVTGVIKANMPTHVALMTANYVDSTTIIGEGGAEKLLGKGDMLVQSPLVSRVGVCRLQSCFINRHEIGRIVGELKSKYPTNFDPDFMNLEEKIEDVSPADMPDCPENDEETKYRFIKDWVMAQEYMSMSKIQRECSVGFNRAGRFFNRLIQEGVVNPTPEGSKGCKVILQNKFGDIDDDDVIATSEDSSYIKR